MGIETAVMAIGAGAQAYGAYSNSKASKTAYDAQAQVNRNNALIAGWQADDALKRGDRNASNIQIRGHQFKGQQRAMLAASGVDLGQGSALQILSDTDYFTGVDAATAKDNAAKEAWALRNQAAGYTTDSNLLQSRADSENPLFAAGTSLLGSAGRVAGNWYAPKSGAAPAPSFQGYGGRY